MSENQTESDYTEPQMRPISKSERIGIWMHEKMFNIRIIACVVLGLIVGVISTCFNVTTASMMSDGHSGGILLPVAFGTIAVCGIVIVTIVFFGRAHAFFKFLGVITLIYIFFLDVFASLTFQVSVDATKELTGDALLIKQVKDNLKRADERVKIWEKKLRDTKKFHEKHDSKLDEAVEKRNEYQQQLHDLEAKNPPPVLAVFNKLYNWVPSNVDNDKVVTMDEFKTLVRGSWSFMMSLLPYIMTILVFAEVKGMMNPQTQGGIASAKKPETSQEDCQDQQENGPEKEDFQELHENLDHQEVAQLEDHEAPYSDELDHLESDHHEDLDQFVECHHDDIEVEPVRSGNVVSLDPVRDRGPDQEEVQPAREVHVGQTWEQVQNLGETEPVEIKRSTRKTGIDRDVAKEIMDYLRDGTLTRGRAAKWSSKEGSISQNVVQKEFGVGKSLVGKIYEKAKGEGLIARDGTGNKFPWYRVNEVKQANNA